jgi:hypothetical protein
VLRQRVALVQGERIVGWSWVGEAGWVVATDQALMASVPGHGTDTDPLRIPWDRVVRARWTDGALEVIGSGGADQPARRMIFDVGEDGLLAEAVRSLVTSAVAWSQRIGEDGAGAWVVARRDRVGEVAWSVVFDAGLDPRDPALRGWADGEVDRIRTQTGL